MSVGGEGEGKGEEGALSLTDTLPLAYLTLFAVMSIMFKNITNNATFRLHRAVEGT